MTEIYTFKHFKTSCLKCTHSLEHHYYTSENIIYCHKCPNKLCFKKPSLWSVYKGYLIMLCGAALVIVGMMFGNESWKERVGGIFTAIIAIGLWEYRKKIFKRNK